MSKNFLTSKETKSVLKISDCELMHIRTAGELKFVKKGNAFMYLESSIKKIEKKKTE